MDRVSRLMELSAYWLMRMVGTDGYPEEELPIQDKLDRIAKRGLEVCDELGISGTKRVSFSRVLMNLEV